MTCKRPILRINSDFEFDFAFGENQNQIVYLHFLCWHRRGIGGVFVGHTNGDVTGDWRPLWWWRAEKFCWDAFPGRRRRLNEQLRDDQIFGAVWRTIFWRWRFNVDEYSSRECRSGGNRSQYVRHMSIRYSNVRTIDVTVRFGIHSHLHIFAVMLQFKLYFRLIRQFEVFGGRAHSP